MARYPGAKFVGAATADYSTQKITHQFIVEHIAQGEFQTGIDAWFHNPKAVVSAHFSISKLGVVHQYVDTDQMAYHCAAWNDKSIGIENLGYTGQHLTLFQKRAQKKLLKWINATHGTRLAYITNPNSSKGGVIGHGKIPEGALSHPDCPGYAVLFDVQAIVKSLAPPAPPKYPTDAQLIKAKLCVMLNSTDAALAVKNGWRLWGWNGTKFVVWEKGLLSGATRYASVNYMVKKP